MISVAEASRKWRENTASPSAITAYKNGISAVTENPMAKAAAKADKYLAGIQEAVQSGKYRESLLAVPEAVWKQNAIDVGASRIASGVKKGASKMESHLTNFLPFLANVQQAVNAMPDTSLEDRIAKSAEMQRRTAAYKRSGQRYT